MLATGLTFDPSRSDKTKDCIDKVLRAITYPKSTAPMITVNHEWQFAMK